MPIIKSAIKRAKQALVRRSRNLQVKRAIKQDTQALHTAIEAGDPTEIQTKLSEAYSEIDRAVKKGTLHKNTAARRKSQLAVHVLKAETTAPAEEVKTTKGAGKKAGVKTSAKKPAAKTTPKAAAAKTAAPKKAAAKPATEKVEKTAAKAPAAKKTPAKTTAKKTEDK